MSLIENELSEKPSNELQALVDADKLDLVRDAIARKILLERKPLDPKQKDSGVGWLPDSMSPNALIFWRHFVALFIAMMLLGSDWQYGIGSVIAMNLGSLLWAIFLSGLALLFATSKVKKIFWKVLIINCWIIAGIVIADNLARHMRVL